MPTANWMPRVHRYAKLRTCPRGRPLLMAVAVIRYLRRGDEAVRACSRQFDQWDAEDFRPAAANIAAAVGKRTARELEDIHFVQRQILHPHERPLYGRVVGWQIPETCIYQRVTRDAAALVPGRALMVDGGLATA